MRHQQTPRILHNSMSQLSWPDLPRCHACMAWKAATPATEATCEFSCIMGSNNLQIVFQSQMSTVSSFFWGGRCKMAVQMRYQLPAYKHMLKPVLKCSQKMSQCSLATSKVSQFFESMMQLLPMEDLQAATMILHTLISLSCGQVSSQTAHQVHYSSVHRGAASVHIHRWLQNGSCLTDDPDRADLFYFPAYEACFLAEWHSCTALFEIASGRGVCATLP